jgi:hypothetical protein
LTRPIVPRKLRTSPETPLSLDADTCGEYDLFVVRVSSSDVEDFESIVVTKRTALRRTMRIPAIVLAAVCSVACNFKSLNAGHEIVLIEKPIIFGHGGVDPNPVRTG